MKLSNVFFFKNIVDNVYSDENRPGEDIKPIVEKVKAKLEAVNNEDFSEIMICCFIPDLYKGMGIKEKLFTKLTELMLGDWWRRMGGTYHLPTKKSGTEDVEMILDNNSIVCDSKVFRLGRSQKAPNVKDFLKLESVRTWIRNLSDSYAKKGIEQTIIGGLVAYSSLHEWESDSEVYQECSTADTPVVMLPYEVLAMLLKYKDYFKLTDLLALWNYRENRVIASREKSVYWKYIKDFICELLEISSEEYDNDIKAYHQTISLAVAEYRKAVENTIAEVAECIKAIFDAIEDIDEIKRYSICEIIKRDNADALDYIKNIDNFRKYSN